MDNSVKFLCKDSVNRAQYKKNFIFITVLWLYEKIFFVPLRPLYVIAVGKRETRYVAFC